MKLSEIKDISGENITMNDIKGSHKKLAKKLGVRPENLKDMTDSEIETIIQDVGNHDFEPNNKFNKSELEKGIRIEYEHTSSRLVAELIAKDHLAELPDYYSRLEKMEKNAEKK